MDEETKRGVMSEMAQRSNAKQKANGRGRAYFQNIARIRWDKQRAQAVDKSGTST